MVPCVVNFSVWSRPQCFMVATMTQEMDKDRGSILQCGRDLGCDHDTLSDESCSVVTTTVLHGRNYDPKR